MVQFSGASRAPAAPTAPAAWLSMTWPRSQLLDVSNTLRRREELTSVLGWHWWLLCWQQSLRERLRRCLGCAAGGGTAAAMAQSLARKALAAGRQWHDGSTEREQSRALSSAGPSAPRSALLRRCSMVRAEQRVRFVTPASYIILSFWRALPCNSALQATSSQAPVLEGRVELSKVILTPVWAWVRVLPPRRGSLRCAHPSASSRFQIMPVSPAKAEQPSSQR